MTTHVIPYEECPDSRYHADDFGELTDGQPTLSSSCARTLLTSARNAWAEHPKLGNLREATPWMKRPPHKRIGSIMHGVMLDCMEEFAIAPEEFRDWKKKDAREFRDQALGDGLLPILRHELEIAQSQAHALSDELLKRNIDLTSGASETTIVYCAEAERGPIWIRTRLDHVDAGGTIAITDLKVHSGGFDESSLLRTIDRYGYNVQQAAYTEAAERAWPDMIGRIDFRFAFLQLSPVPDVLVVRVDGGIREVGERYWHHAKERWAQCLYTNHWPGYGHEIATVHAEPWFARKHNL